MNFPWEEWCRSLAKHCGWTPRQVLEEQSLGQLLGIWSSGGTSSPGHDEDARRAKINRLRAKKGLPPMKPDPTRPKG